MQLFCGEPMCKRQVAQPAAVSWPLRCSACGTALYPSDVLRSTPANELEPKVAELMTEKRGARVAVTSADFSTPRTRDAQASAQAAAIDRLLDRVDVDPQAAVRRRRNRAWVVVALVVVVLACVIAFFARRG